VGRFRDGDGQEFYAARKKSASTVERGRSRVDASERRSGGGEGKGEGREIDGLDSANGREDGGNRRNRARRGGRGVEVETGRTGEIERVGFVEGFGR